MSSQKKVCGFNWSHTGFLIAKVMKLWKLLRNNSLMKWCKGFYIILSIILRRWDEHNLNYFLKLPYRDVNESTGNKLCLSKG